MGGGGQVIVYVLFLHKFYIAISILLPQNVIKGFY